MRFLIIFFTLFFLIGCRENITENIVTKNQAITKTKKKEVTIDGRRFLAVGTYLNDISHPSTPKDDNEHFIVSLYEGDENPYQNPLKEVFLNEEPAYWEVLEKGDPFLNLLPLFNAWGYYYHIWAPKQYPDEMQLDIKIDEERQVSLKFQKDPK
jgi:hypothetical protein